MAIIKIKDGIEYDTEKTFDDQTEAFIEYTNGLYQDEVTRIYDTEPKNYPPFDDTKGLSISYQFQDDKLNYTWKRFQIYPKSTSNRSVKGIEYIIIIK